MTGRDWCYLLGLSAFWGSSYLFIKLAVEGFLAPAELVLLRLLIATAVLYLVARLQGLRLPRDRQVWRSFAIMGFVGSAVPFLLISWGETAISSSLAAILNATVPIMTILLAHFWTRQEHLTVPRVVGVLVGFAGVVVVVLLGNDVDRGAHGAVLLGVLALLVSSLCYGIAGNVARRSFGGVPPGLASTGQMALGSVFMLVPGVAGGLSTRHAPTLGALAAMVALALIGTVGAYLLYYRLIARVGATRTAMATYLLPAFAILYGALFLHEAVNPGLLGGFVLILLGVAVVSGRIRLPREAAPAPSAGAAR